MRLSVLVIEHDELALKTVCQMVEASGHIVFKATNQSTALGILDAIRIDIVVTSLALSQAVDGLALAAIVKQAQPGVSVVLATGSGGLSLDCYPRVDVCIRKPYDLVQLQDALGLAMKAKQTPTS